MFICRTKLAALSVMLLLLGTFPLNVPVYADGEDTSAASSSPSAAASTGASAGAEDNAGAAQDKKLALPAAGSLSGDAGSSGDSEPAGTSSTKAKNAAGALPDADTPASRLRARAKDLFSQWSTRGIKPAASKPIDGDAKTGTSNRTGVKPDLTESKPDVHSQQSAGANEANAELAPSTSGKGADGTASSSIGVSKGADGTASGSAGVSKGADGSASSAVGASKGADGSVRSTSGFAGARKNTDGSASSVGSVKSIDGSASSVGSVKSVDGSARTEDSGRGEPRSPVAKSVDGSSKSSDASSTALGTAGNASLNNRTSSGTALNAPHTGKPQINAGANHDLLARNGQTVAQENLLPNGLKVLILENHEFPVVSTLVWYRVGSRDEQAGATGLSHMVEHLMFQDVGPFKPGDIGNAIARVGGQFNGYTSDDFTTFFETLPANKLEMALKIESERMNHTRFNPAQVRQEISNIYSEFENEAKDPVALLSREVRAAVFTQHPYHNPTLGRKSDVEGLTAEHARTFYEKYFSPSNATLIISGDVNSKHVMSLVHKYFASAVAVKLVSHAAVSETAQRSERHVSTKYSGNKEVLQVAYRAPAMNDPDAAAMVVLERLLNGGAAGRLKGKFVESKVCAAAQSSFEIKREPGLFTITCTAIPGTPNAQSKILEALDGFISQLRAKPLSDSEIKSARNQAEFSYYAECDGPYRAGFHLGYFDCLDRWQDSYTWADRLRAVSAADLNRVAKKYLSPETRVVGWIAGAQAAKPSSPKVSLIDKDKDKEHDKLTSARTMEHARLTAYKTDDDDDAPSSKKHSSKKANADKKKKADSKKITAKAAAKDKKTADAGKGKDSKGKDAAAAKNASSKDGKVAKTADSSKSKVDDAKNKTLTKNKESKADDAAKASAAANSDIAAINDDNLTGNANKSKVKAKKSGLPAVVHDIPTALGDAVTGNIPGAVGNVGAALINLPGAIGNIGTAVGSTATALGRHIEKLRSMSEPEFEHISHRVLKNGINIIVFQSHISPVVQISGSLQAGEAYSSRNKPGSSLLAACLLNQGSIDHNRAQMTSAQDEIGIAPAQMLKFESGVETIDFSTRCLSRDLGTQLNLVAETLSKPDLLDDGTIDKAQQDALSVLKRNDDSVPQKADRVLLSSLLDENSPFCPADPSDTAKAIAQADLAQAQKFFANHVVPGATTIVLAGDCNADEVFALADKAFADWDGKGSHAELHAKSRVQRVLRSTVPIKDCKKTSIGFGQIIPMTQAHPEYGSLLLADSILVNHPMFSRFEKALSKTPALDNAIANGDMNVKLEPVSNLTRWSLLLSVDPSAVPLSIKTVRNELKTIAQTGVTSEELVEVKRYLLGSLPVRTQGTLGAICNSMLDSAEHSDTVNGYIAQLSSVRAATVDSVNKVIRNVFKPAESTVVIAGGAQSIRAGRNSSVPDATESANPDSSSSSQPAVSDVSNSSASTK